MITNFKRVLIANRGEIALRIVRACRDASLTSIAIYAEPDEGAPFARLGDEALPLTGTAPAGTYLDIATLMAAAEQSGAEAVHPSYGFMAENAAFAQAVLDAGLAWIGPPPAVIRALGDKAAARAIAARAGAPLLPGEPVAGPAEAMKMENPLRVPHPGRVSDLRVSAGDTVAQGTVSAVSCRARDDEVRPLAGPSSGGPAIPVARGGPGGQARPGPQDPPGPVRGPASVLILGQHIVSVGFQEQLHEHRVHRILLTSARPGAGRALGAGAAAPGQHAQQAAGGRVLRSPRLGQHGGAR